MLTNVCAGIILKFMSRSSRQDSLHFWLIFMMQFSSRHHFSSNTITIILRPSIAAIVLGII